MQKLSEAPDRKRATHAQNKNKTKQIKTTQKKTSFRKRKKKLVL